MKNRFLAGIGATILASSGFSSLIGLGAGAAHANGFSCELIPDSEIVSVGLYPVTMRRTGDNYDCTFYTPKGNVMFFERDNEGNDITSLPASLGKSHLVNGHAVVQEPYFGGCGDAISYVPKYVIVVTHNCAQSDELAEYITGSQ